MMCRSPPPHLTFLSHRDPSDKLLLLLNRSRSALIQFVPLKACHIVSWCCLANVSNFADQYLLASAFRLSIGRSGGAGADANYVESHFQRCPRCFTAELRGFCVSDRGRRMPLRLPDMRNAPRHERLHRSGACRSYACARKRSDSERLIMNSALGARTLMNNVCYLA